jgi:WD40 repeat protein
MSSKPALHSTFRDGVVVTATLKGQIGLIRSLAWSPDGERIFASSIDGKVCLWNVLRNRPEFTRGISRKIVNDVSWSPDGKLVACTTEGGELIIWSPGDYQIETRHAFGGSLECVRWSPNGSTLVLAGIEHNLYVVHCENGKSRTLKPLLATVQVLWLSPGHPMDNSSSPELRTGW